MRRPFATLALLACAIAAMVALPTSAGATSNVSFGIEQFGNMENPVYTDMLQKTMRRDGATVERYVVRWDWVARSCDPATAGSVSDMNNPCYSWTFLDEIVRKAQSNGLEMLFSIYGTPRWMFGQSENYVGTTDAQYAQFVTSYASFAQAVATRYDGRHGLPRVPQITIWNEPNGSFFQPRTVDGVLVSPARYATLVDAAARRIKAVDPSLQVAAGPTAPHSPPLPPMPFVRIVIPLLQRMGTPIDAWAHNAYTGRQSPLHNYTIKDPYVGLGNVDDLTALMDRYPVTAHKPLWITEFGYQTGGGQKAIEPEQQPALLADALFYAWKHPRITMLIWYQLSDDAYTTKYSFMSGLYYELSHSCGSEICPKPGAAMYRHTVWASARSAKGLVTLWAQGRSVPAKTQLFIRRPGDGWRSYINADTSSTGTVYVTMALPVGTIAMACDTACGPTTTIHQAAVSGGGTSSTTVRRLKTVALSRRLAAQRGISLSVGCTRTCRVTGQIRATGRMSGFAAARGRTVLVGRAFVHRSASRTTVRFVFSASARRELLRRSRAQVTLRLILRYTSGRIAVYDRVVRLR